MRLREREHFSHSIMVSVGASRMKKISVVIVEPYAKVNSKYYFEHFLRPGFLNVIQATCGRHNWTLRQDGTLSHTASNMINFLLQESITFIELDKWQPNSSDLKSYAILGALQEKSTFGENLPQFTIIDEYRNLGQHSIDCKRVAPMFIKSR